MTSISKNVYIDKLDELVNKYRIICHRTIKMKRVDVNSSISIDFNKENNMEDPNFKVGENVRISKYKSIFAKGFVTNWSEEVFVVAKVKKTVYGQMLLVILKVKKLLERFAKKEFQKINQKEFRVEKVIKKVINYMLNGKAMIILLTVELTKKTR